MAPDCACVKRQMVALKICLCRNEEGRAENAYAASVKLELAADDAVFF
jgi:hypothetical protein